jgi:hypothetical protein
VICAVLVGGGLVGAASEDVLPVPPVLLVSVLLVSVLHAASAMSATTSTPRI